MPYKEKLLEHSAKVYAEMEKQAKYDDEHNTLLWEGHLTSLFEELGYGVPSYTRIMNALKAMDCVVQLQRGNSASPSIWLLLRDPTKELYNFWRESEEKRPKRAKSSDQRLRDLSDRVAALEELIKGE